MKFRKKPVVIEAVQYTGKNLTEVFKFSDPVKYIEDNRMFLSEGDLVIKTLEGKMVVSKMDWIIRGVNGELYPCKPDAFEKSYEDPRIHECLMSPGLITPKIKKQKDKQGNVDNYILELSMEGVQVETVIDPFDSSVEDVLDEMVLLVKKFNYEVSVKDFDDHKPEVV